MCPVLHWRALSDTNEGIKHSSQTGVELVWLAFSCDTMCNLFASTSRLGFFASLQVCHCIAQVSVVLQVGMRVDLELADGSKACGVYVHKKLSDSAG